jgi:hypothetical protein
MINRNCQAAITPNRVSGDSRRFGRIEGVSARLRGMLMQIVESRCLSEIVERQTGIPEPSTAQASGPKQKRHPFRDGVLIFLSPVL